MEIINHFNINANRTYGEKGAHIDQIVDLLKQGETKDTIKRYITQKCESLIGTKNDYCLRPYILFSKKFYQDNIGELPADDVQVNNYHYAEVEEKYTIEKMRSVLASQYRDEIGRAHV